jgi:Raf kinase inhibitor-like YbhB/YbcL family protein
VTWRTALRLVAALALLGCQQPAAEIDVPETIELSSHAFPDGGEIPQRHTCDGEDVPPPLAWTGIPDGAQDLALLVEDPDAPGGTFVHWVVAGLPANTERLNGELPPTAVEGRNGFGTQGYRGPCPPEGDEPHHYRFTLVAADRRLGLADGVSADELRRAFDGSALAQGRLTGVYGR